MLIRFYLLGRNFKSNGDRNLKYSPIIHYIELYRLNNLKKLCSIELYKKLKLLDIFLFMKG